MNTLGIDVGGTTIKAVVADRQGQILSSWQVPTPPGGDATIAGVADLVTQIESEIAGTIDIAREVTVAVPGIVDEASGMALLSVNLGWTDYPMRDRLIEALKRPVGLAHDVRSGALAEARWGLALPSCHYIAMGTGLASALIVNNEISRPHPWAGEIGQIPVTGPSGDTVPLERLCSANAFAEIMESCSPGSLPAGAGAKEVFQAHWAGNPVATDAIHTGLSYLTQAIVWMTYTTGPLPVVIGGGMAKEGPRLTDLINAHLAPFYDLIAAPEVHLAQLGSWSQALGAAAAAQDMVAS